jgi:23S rRNA-/tRNA-specific pseudouridylate synthase
MLQRVRDALHDIDTRGLADDDAKPPIRKVNLVHRLDQGASGALLLTYAEGYGSNVDSDNSNDSDGSEKGDTAQLIEAMASPESIKTYVALVRGEGILRGENLREKGWFDVSRPIKDEDGKEKDATTSFQFVAGQPETGFDRPRISLVLAVPRMDDGIRSGAI